MLVSLSILLYQSSFINYSLQDTRGNLPGRPGQLMKSQLSHVPTSGIWGNVGTKWKSLPTKPQLPIWEVSWSRYPSCVNHSIQRATMAGVPPTSISAEPSISLTRWYRQRYHLVSLRIRLKGGHLYSIFCLFILTKNAWLFLAITWIVAHLTTSLTHAESLILKPEARQRRWWLSMEKSLARER